MRNLRATWSETRIACGRFALALALATWTWASPAQLVTWTGAGSNTNWATGQNWSTGAQPTTSGTLVFSGTTRTTSSNDITSGTFGGLNFTNTGATGSTSAFSLSGNAFTLAGGGSITTSATTAGSALTDTLATNIVLGTNATITTNAGHNLSVSGTISGSGFGITKTGGATLTLSGSNTFDGPVSLQAGTIQVNSINNAGVAGSLGTTGTITLFTTTNLDYRGEAASTDRSFIIGSGGAIGAGFLYNGTAGGGLTFTSGTFNVPTTASSNRNITIFGGSTGTSVIQGVIQDNSGAGATIGLTKALGDHTWRLSGANTFSGGVIVQGQTLQIDSWSALGTGTSAVMIGHLNNSAQLEYLGASGTTSRQIQIGNGTTAAQSPVVTLLSNGSGPIVFTSGTFNFAQTNAINTNARRLELSGANTGVNEIQGAIVNNAANAVATGSGAVALLKTGAGRWVLSGSSTYSGTTTVGAGTLQIGNNGTTGSLPTSSVITGSAGATLAFNRTDTIASGTDFNNAIGGAINVRQIGSGTLLFNAAQSYTGTTRIDAGTLKISGGGNNSTGALASPSIVVNSGATLQLSQNAALGWTAGRAAVTIAGGTVTTDAGLRTSLANTVTMIGGVLTSAGAGDSNGNYNLLDSGVVATSDASGNAATISAQKVALQFSAGSGTATFNVTRGSASPASDLTISATIANFGGSTAGIKKTGNGILTLSAANTYTGTTTIDAGTLRITGGGNNSTGALASPSIVVNSGATLQLSQNAALGWTAGRAAVTIAGGTVTTDAGLRTSLGNTVTMTGGVLTSAGAGDTFGNYNLLDSGVVATSDASGNAATISAQKVALQFSAGSGTSAFNVTRGSASPASDLSISAVIANFGGAAGITKTGNGILSLSGANTYTGSTTIDAGTLRIGNGGTAGSLSASTAVTIASGGTLAFNRTDAYGGNFANTISGSGGVTLVSGSLTFSTVKTYTGQTRVSGGMLALGAADAISNQSSLLVDGGGFNLAGFNDTVGSVTITSGSIYGNGMLTSATYGLGGGRVAANLGAGTLAVTANSSLDGSSAATVVTLNAGTLTLGSGGRFTAASVAVSGSNGASLTLGGNEAFGSLAGAASIALGSSTLTVGAANAATTYSGVLSGVGGLTKVGSGVFTLANANTYSGNTVISGSGSVLKLGGAGSFANSPVIVVGDAASTGAILDLTAKSGAFAIGNGQTLKGGGTIQLAADGVLDVQGTFAPGNSPGLFMYDGGTTLLSGTTIMEIFGTNRATLASHGADPFYDAVDVINGGTLTLGGLLTLDITGTYTDNTTFNLFSASAGSSLSGNFANIVFSESSSYAGLTFTSGTGNPKVWTSTTTTAGQSFTFDAAVGTLVIVPEPSAVIGAGIGIAMAGWSLWKRRRCSHTLRR